MHSVRRDAEEKNRCQPARFRVSSQDHSRRVSMIKSLTRTIRNRHPAPQKQFETSKVIRKHHPIRRIRSHDQISSSAGQAKPLRMHMSPSKQVGSNRWRPSTLSLVGQGSVPHGHVVLVASIGSIRIRCLGSYGRRHGLLRHGSRSGLPV